MHRKNIFVICPCCGRILYDGRRFPYINIECAGCGLMITVDTDPGHLRSTCQRENDTTAA